MGSLIERGQLTGGDGVFDPAHAREEEVVRGDR